MKKPDLTINDHRGVISLEKYAGCWVALAQRKVVAHQNSLGKLMKKVGKIKKKTSVFLVPKKSDSPYIL